MVLMVEPVMIFWLMMLARNKEKNPGFSQVSLDWFTGKSAENRAVVSTKLLVGSNVDFPMNQATGKMKDASIDPY